MIILKDISDYISKTQSSLGPADQKPHKQNRKSVIFQISFYRPKQCTLVIVFLQTEQKRNQMKQHIIFHSNNTNRLELCHELDCAAALVNETAN
jgi:hypothetical protein